MIYCPRCGTANRDGSRFCNECGEELGTQMQPKCPQCGTLNPVQNVFCSDCGGRLLSSAPSTTGPEATQVVKGLSLPTKPPMGDEPVDPDSEEDSPPWLSELGATAYPPPQAGEPIDAGDAEEIPDWLQDLQASLPEEPESMVPQGEGQEAEQTPDRLADTDPTAPVEEAGPSAAAPEIEEGDISDWLDDLRPAAPAEEPEPAASPPETEKGDAPDWLADPGPTPPAEEPVPAAPDPEPKKEEAPDLLADLRPTVPVEESEPAALTPEAEEGDVPDWLADLGTAPAAEEPTPAAQAPEIEEEETPDWLADLRPTAPAEEPQPAALTTEAEEGDVPDWLAELGPTPAVEEPAPTAPAPEVAEGEVPGWLADISAAAPPEELVPAAPAPDIEEAEVPDLQEIQEPEQEEGASSETAEVLIAAGLAAAGAAAAEMPDWLSELKPAAEIEETAAEETPESAETPGWLASMAPAAPEEETLVGEALAEAELPDWLVPSEGDGASDSLEQAEIPTWLLALKPHELREEDGEVEIEEPPPVIQEGVEEAGLLAGLAGTLPVEMLIAQPRTTAAEAVAIVPKADLPKARLFADIVARPPSVTPKAVAQPRPHVLSKIPRLIIYLALIVAVAIPLLLGKSLLTRPVEASQAALDLHQAIDSLPGSAPVLVVFDYDPASSDELDVVASAITSHLTSRKARLVAFSLLPTGPAMAQNILEETAAEDQYVNLGYLPGHAMAVRLLGQSIEAATPRDYQGTPLAELTLMEGIDSLNDFELIIELAATQNNLRWWIEQGSTPYDVPLGAGVSASTDPLARPYYETEPRQLMGLVSGVQGAAMYDSLTSGQDSVSDALGARLDAQLAGHIVFILVLVIGNAIYFFQRRTGEDR